MKYVDHEVSKVCEYWSSLGYYTDCENSTSAGKKIQDRAAV